MQKSAAYKLGRALAKQATTYKERGLARRAVGGGARGAIGGAALGAGLGALPNIEPLITGRRGDKAVSRKDVLRQMLLAMLQSGTAGAILGAPIGAAGDVIAGPRLRAVKESA